MSEALQTGFLLLMVGMITVFSVLGIVVLTGRVIIYTLNRSGTKIESRLTRDVRSISTKNELQASPQRSRKMAVVVAAAQITSKGKGRIVSIQRGES